MTRTHKATDRDHAGLANGTAAPEEHLPRYFAKAGFVDANPSSTKKQGGGKGNWGREGESELEDYAVNMSKARRRTNSSSLANHPALRTKFETLDPEVIEYDEYMHGPATTTAATVDGTEELPQQPQHELEKMSTSSTTGSTEEEDAAHHATAAAGTTDSRSN